ncbi:MAG: chemotaxis protein CheW [Lachnospiraceae bacterium]|nr:chemotaxis protein CheW [Lachnospiraceae bacterium]
MNDLSDKESLGELIQYIVIRLGEEQFGIDIRYVDNIVRMQQITRVPKVQHYIKGVINIRGDIVPVMSLRLIMEMNEDELTGKTRIIIVKMSGGSLVGFIVDQVAHVLTLDSNNVENVRRGDDRRHGEFLSGVGKYEGGLVSILDLNTLELESLEGRDREREKQLIAVNE